jgi:hypothetical protein
VIEPRTVTPEVAGSSPVAPVSKLPVETAFSAKGVAGVVSDRGFGQLVRATFSAIASPCSTGAGLSVDLSLIE